MGFLYGPQYLALPRSSRTWIVEDLVPSAGAVNIYGKAKAGKSFAALQLAAAIGNPQESMWMGFPVQVHGAVAYLQVDTPRGIWRDRVVDCASRGCDFSYVAFGDLEDPDLPYPFNITSDHAITYLETMMREIAPVAVIIDVLREIHGGDENDSGHMRNVIGMLRAATRGAALVILSHSRKQAQGVPGDLIEDQRGSSYIAGRMDAIIRLTDKTMTYQSRTTEEGSFAIARNEVGMVQLADPIHSAALDLIRTRGSEPDLHLARSLHQQFPRRSLDACRSLIRRLKAHRVAS